MGDVTADAIYIDPQLGDANERNVAKFRRRIDVAIVRALADPRYAEDLLKDPAAALATDCGFEQRAGLRAIRAHSVREFAQQSLVLFWPRWRWIRYIYR